MIKIIYYFILLFTISLFQTVLAQAATPSPTFINKNPSPTIEIAGKAKLIEELKEKIATKVAEIRNKDKTAIFGKIKSIDKSSILITSDKDYTLNTTEDTSVYSLKEGTRNDSTLSNLKKDMYVTIFGYQSDDKDSISGKYIYIQNDEIYLSGKIADKDTSNFTITVKTKQGDYITDVEKTTKTNIYSMTKKTLTKGGYSSLKIGDIVLVTGISSDKENRISAIKILSIQGFNITPTPTKEISPSPTKKPKT